MMNKIFNWTIGSFFRTLGRVAVPIALLLIGVLIGGCDVQALESTYKPGYTVPLAIRQASLISPTEFNKSAYGNINTDDSFMPAFIHALYNGGGYTYETYGTFITFCPNEGFIANHTYTLRFITATLPGSYANNQYYRFGTAWNQPIKLVNSIGANPITSGVYVKGLTTNHIQYTDVLSQDWSYITELTATFTAPSQNTCISINIDMNANFSNQVLNFLGYMLIDSGVDNSEQLDDIKDSVSDVNDSIKDSNTTDSEDKANSFFDNFENTDHGGISGIITAPLVAINQMLNGTCTPMSVDYKEKTISLPCGYDFWGKMPEIQNFYNLVAGGLLCYAMILKLFKMIENLKNPDDDRVEVMDL